MRGDRTTKPRRETTGERREREEDKSEKESEGGIDGTRIDSELERRDRRSEKEGQAKNEERGRRKEVKRNRRKQWNQDERWREVLMRHRE